MTRARDRRRWIAHGVALGLYGALVVAVFARLGPDASRHGLSSIGPALILGVTVIAYALYALVSSLIVLFIPRVWHAVIVHVLVPIACAFAVGALFFQPAPPRSRPAPTSSTAP